MSTAWHGNEFQTNVTSQDQ